MWIETRLDMHEIAERLAPLEEVPCVAIARVVARFVRRQLKQAVEQELLRPAELARVRRVVRSVLDDFVALANALGPDRRDSGAPIEAWIRDCGGPDEVVSYDELCAFALSRLGAHTSEVLAAYDRGELDALEIACGPRSGERGPRPDLDALPRLVYGTLDLLDPFRVGERASQASDFVDAAVEDLLRIEQELREERARPPAPAPVSAATLRGTLHAITDARAYRASEAFASRDALRHVKFGVGVVASTTHDSILVVFADAERRLVHRRT